MSQVKVVLKRSLIGSTKQQKAAVRCLGLRKIGQSVVLSSHSAVQGQINKVKHLLSVESVDKE